MKCFKCMEEISPSVLEFFFVQIGEGLLEKYQKISFNDFIMSKGGEIMWCPTPGCDFGFEFAEKFSRLDCKVCNKSWCLDCRVEYHKNISCRDFKRSKDVNYLDQEFDRVAERLKFKPCPRCKFWIEKSEVIFFVEFF